jgi:hypothetical protein
MNDLIEKIGPVLGIVAFLGLAILAFLIIQQAREVRRLREWAGRAPERAGEAADASAAAAEARGEAVEADEPAGPNRLSRWWAGVRERAAPRYAALDRRMPVDPRYLLAVLAAGVVAAAVLTGGFGLLGGDDSATGGDGGKGDEKKDKIEVAVLNATQEEDTVTGEPIAGVQGLANKVADEVVKPAGYKAGAETDAADGVAETVIMYDTSEGEADAAANEEEASELADAIAKKLGETNLVEMTEDVRELSKGAPLALLIGADDADF